MGKMVEEVGQGLMGGPASYIPLVKDTLMDRLSASPMFTGILAGGLFNQ